MENKELELFKQEVISAVIAFSKGELNFEIAKTIINSNIDNKYKDKCIENEDPCSIAKEILMKFNLQ